VAERASYTFSPNVPARAARARRGRHTPHVGKDPAHESAGGSAIEITERLVPLLDATHQVWSAPQERRRLRAFGFRPAVEPGVLKREWHGAQVRVGPDALRVVADGGGELAWTPDSGLTLDDAPFHPTPGGIALADAINSLIQGYERWIEAREGREERLRRGHWSSANRRQVNALAETRRLQRLLSGGVQRATR
jgi:hypothetical protein